ncbi:hypothetical protein EDB84DRAFT_1580538, partial [Lactarius hengduanensis]
MLVLFLKSSYVLSLIQSWEENQPWPSIEYTLEYTLETQERARRATHTLISNFSADVPLRRDARHLIRCCVGAGSVWRRQEDKGAAATALHPHATQDHQGGGRHAARVRRARLGYRSRLVRGGLAVHIRVSTRSVRAVNLSISYSNRFSQIDPGVAEAPPSHGPNAALSQLTHLRHPRLSTPSARRLEPPKNTVLLRTACA